MSFVTHLIQNRFFLESYRVFTLVGISLLFLVCMSIDGFAKESEMILGVVSDTQTNSGMDVLRAFRSSVFIALVVMCYKALKARSKLFIAHAIWLITTALLSIFAVNTDRYVGVPDFSYFSVFLFMCVATNIYSSVEYLRRVLVTHNKSGLYDNMIIVISILCIAVIAIIGINNPILAADIVFVSWGSVIIIGTICAIYMIANKSVEADLQLLGWIPAQIGLIIALGVGTNGNNVAVITAITAWSSLIIAHIFLAILTYLVGANAAHRNNSQVKPHTHSALDDSVSFIIDKAVFRVKNDKKKIILNEACAKMLHISGRQSEFSIEAFKGLIASDCHHVVDKMLTGQMIAPEKIKFHTCTQKGLLQPLQCKANDIDTDTDTLFIYQEIEGFIPLPDTVPMTENIVKSSQRDVLDTQERRKSSDMMYFITKITDILTDNHQTSGDYVLLLFKIQYYDDWQVVLGVSQAYEIVKNITETIKNCLNGFDNLVVKNFSGDMIGIFCHIVTVDTEVERLKSIIYKHFEMPILVSKNHVFVNFNHGVAKINIADTQKSLSSIGITNLVTNMIDVAKHQISLYQEGKTTIDVRQLSLPEGSNIIQLSSDLRYAPERGQINAYYEPIIDLKTQEIIGFNISPIWRHPDFSIITGDLLEYLSQRSRIDNTINRLVIAKAIEGMVKFYRLQTMPIMSFKISRNLALGASIDEEIKNLCDFLKISPSSFRLEFSPNCLGDNPKWLATILSDLKSIGVSTVLSGFGSAKGQLASLANLAFDRVIIDSGFSENMMNNERKFFALKSLTTMLKNMAIKPDIQDVASKDSFKFLLNAGIENVSGSAIGEPMPAERAVNLLTKNREVNNIS